MKKLFGTIALCAFLAGIAPAAQPVSHAKPQHKAAQKRAKKPRKNAKARKPAARKAPVKKAN